MSERNIPVTPDKVAVLREALEAIKRMTDADDPGSYRCDDREGCLDTVFARASRALEETSDER